MTTGNRQGAVEKTAGFDSQGVVKLALVDSGIEI